MVGVVGRGMTNMAWLPLLLGGIAVPGCSDQVVGLFGSSGSSGDLGAESSVGLTFAASDTGFEPPSGSDGASGDGTGSDTGSGAFVPPGCYGDDFEDGVVDPDLWNAWTEENSNVEEVGGWIKFTPPTYGLFDTGLVANYLHQVPFENAWARMQITAPPSATRPVVLFLQVVEEPMVMSIRIAEDTISIDASNDFAPIYSESFPAQPYPGWVGIRAEGDLVHYETSDDGVTWSILSTQTKPAAFAAARPLIMAQTYGEDLEGGIVAVDNFEVCVQ